MALELVFDLLFGLVLGLQPFQQLLEMLEAYAWLRFERRQRRE